MAAAVVIAFAGRLSAQECEVPKKIALKFPDCRAVPSKPSVRILGQTYPVTPVDGGYWKAEGLPPFTPDREGITVLADGVPMYCASGGTAQNVPGLGCAAVYTLDCSSSWLLEVASKPASAFTYTRALDGTGGCTGENKTKITTQLLDVGRDEVLGILINGANGAPRVEISRDKIEKKGKGGVLRLTGLQILHPDAGENAPVKDTKVALAAATAQLNGLKEVSFQKK